MLNVFGAAVETIATVAKGEALPGAPRGHAWQLITGTSPTSSDDLGEG